MLSTESASDALARLKSMPAATGQHFLLVDPGQIISAESSADGIFACEQRDDRIAHTNHCLAAPEREVSSSRGEGFSGQTMARLEFVDEQLDRLSSTDDLMSVLSDRSVPISKAIEDKADNSLTFGAYALRSQRQPAAWWSIGPPHESGWEHLEFHQ
jgi:hypothetical protein